MEIKKRLFAAATIVLVGAGFSAIAPPASAAPPTIATFNHTSATQPFVVPSGVNEIRVDVFGAQGGSGQSGGGGGAGAAVHAELSVTPLEQLQVNVGGAGAGTAAGFNGGGSGGDAGSLSGGFGAGGGGASDIRRTPYALGDRLVVAGGGGGGGGFGGGGGAGGVAGVDGGDSEAEGGKAGGAGGAGGTGGAGGAAGGAGAAGQGGAGGSAVSWDGGGGGGGGWRGGGGGGAAETGAFGGGGGGGGSSNGPSGSSFDTGVRLGDGQVVITYDISPPVTTFTKKPANRTTKRSATFAFTADEPDVTFECNLDGGGFFACTSPQRFTGLSRGPHTFEVRATDDFGNVGPTATDTWKRVRA